MILKYWTRPLVIVAVLLLYVASAYSSQSTITEVEGYSCMGEEKGRKQTRENALIDAKRKAVEYAVSYIKSETKIKNFELEKDLVEAYATASVKVIESREIGWYKDERSGECFKVMIKAEVIPDEKAMKNVISKTEVADDPGMPLKVSLWTDKKEYSKDEKIRIYIKGNKPFYARIVHNDVRGELLQLFPNPYRKDNYFNGSVIYEIPSGNDRFELEARPPFGEENIVLYASTSQLGEIDLENAGSLYRVRTRSADVGDRTRGIKIVAKGGQKTSSAEFFEETLRITTKK